MLSQTNLLDVVLNCLGWGDFFIFQTARGKTVNVSSATPAILVIFIFTSSGRGCFYFSLPTIRQNAPAISFSISNCTCFYPYCFSQLKFMAFCILIVAGASMFSTLLTPQIIPQPNHKHRQTTDVPFKNKFGGPLIILGVY